VPTSLPKELKKLSYGSDKWEISIPFGGIVNNTTSWDQQQKGKATDRETSNLK
jgi:hypothetical protein